jgi:DNA-3-methyladenine glycosylase I
VEELMNFSGIVRNRKKIESAIENAKLFLKIQKEFGSFNEYIWSFVGGKTIQNAWKTQQEVPCLSKESTALSDDMRKRGFRFIGPVIMYSHMQATGLINDHLIDCFCYQECLKS